MKTIEKSFIYPENKIELLDKILRESFNFIDIRVFDIENNTSISISNYEIIELYGIKGKVRSTLPLRTSSNMGTYLRIEWYASYDFMEDLNDCELQVRINIDGTDYTSNFKTTLHQKFTTNIPITIIVPNKQYREEACLTINKSLTSIPRWASIYQNSYNNYQKIVKPIFTSMENLNKNIFKAKFKQTLELDGRPIEVISGDLELAEGYATDSFKDISTSAVNREITQKIYYKDQFTAIGEVLFDEPNYLYFRKLTINNSSVIYIRGKKNGIIVEESLQLYENIYRCTINKYDTILEIFSGQDIQFTNILLGNIVNTNIPNTLLNMLPYVDKEFVENYIRINYKPYSEYTEITINDRHYGYLDDEVTSLFLTYDYDLIWTTTNNKLKVSKLTENTQKYKSNLSTNSYITYHNINYKDWTNISIKISNYFSDFPDTNYVLLKCIHAGVEYYYDIFTESLSLEKVFISRETRDFSFDILIEDDVPYYVSIVEENNVITTPVSVNVIKPITVVEISNNLVVAKYDEEFKLIPKLSDNYTINTETEFPNSITFYWNNSQDLDFTIRINNMTFGYNNTSISNKYVYNISEDTADNLEKIFVDFKAIRHDFFNNEDISLELGTAWYDNSNIDISNNVNCLIKDEYNRSILLTLNPKVHTDYVRDIEYTIVIPANPLSQITATLNGDY